MNSYLVEINGQPFVVHAYTVEDAERVALSTFEGLVTSLETRMVEEEPWTSYEPIPLPTGA